MSSTTPPPDLKPLKWIAGGAIVAFALVIVTLGHRILTREKPSLPWPTAQELEILAKDPQALIKGQAIFLLRCANCHGKRGEGQSAPNLTDHFWIHGKAAPLDILRVIREGSLQQGMPSWEGVLTDQELNSTAVYVHSLQGTKPIGGKAPQGDPL